MIHRALTNDLHPGVFTRVQIDRCDAAVRRLDEGQIPRTVQERTYASDVFVGTLLRATLSQRQERSTRVGGHIQHARRQIGGGTRPVGGAHDAGEEDGVSLRRWCIEWPVFVLLINSPFPAAARA